MVGMRWPVRVLAMLSSAVLIGACSGSAAAPTLGPGGGGSGGAGPTIGTSPAPSIGFPFNFSLPPEPTWPPVGGLVRIVNLYDPGIEPPFAVDVRQQSFVTTSEPLLTVQPGTASAYFDPGDEGDGSTDLAFFRAGGTQAIDQVMSQGWNHMKDRQITMVLMTSGTSVSDPTSSASPTTRNLGATYVVEEHGGENPRPTAVAGKGLLWVDSQPLNELPSGGGWVAPALGLGDGNCLLAVGDAGPLSFVFGQQAFAFPPGPVKLNVYSPVANPDECKGKPVFGPIAATIEADKEQVVILYGRDLTALKTLLLPIGS